MTVQSLIAVCAAGFVGSAVAGVSSSFDADAEGWGTLNDARDVGWTGDVGNPAGAFTARDRGDGRIWYYAASAAYLGDRSGNVGGSLSWDILGITGNQTTIPALADVMLSGGGLVVGLDADVQPVNGTWTSWGVDLVASAGWEVVSSTSGGTLSGNAVSAAEFAAVLANLDALYIRGEYTNGADATALDNVSLLVPTPGTVGVLAVVGIVARRRRAR